LPSRGADFYILKNFWRAGLKSFSIVLHRRG
jgi:hypothetical protein